MGIGTVRLTCGDRDCEQERYASDDHGDGERPAAPETRQDDLAHEVGGELDCARDEEIDVVVSAESGRVEREPVVNQTVHKPAKFTRHWFRMVVQETYCPHSWILLGR